MVMEMKLNTVEFYIFLDIECNRICYVKLGLGFIHSLNFFHIEFLCSFPCVLIWDMLTNLQRWTPPPPCAWDIPYSLVLVYLCHWLSVSFEKQNIMTVKLCELWIWDTGNFAIECLVSWNTFSCDTLLQNQVIMPWDCNYVE